MMFDPLASAYSQIYKLSWLPQHNWRYSGDNWTVLISGTRGRGWSELSHVICVHLSLTQRQKSVTMKTPSIKKISGPDVLASPRGICRAFPCAREGKLVLWFF